MSRRSMLIALASGCAGLITAEALGGHFPFKRQVQPLVRKGQILSQHQMADLHAMVEIIIPATQTLGAGSVDTHGFIDDQLAHCMAPEKAKEFIQLFDTTRQGIKKTWKTSYAELSHAQQVEAMKALASKTAPFESTEGFFPQLKRLTVLGYYTSEEGGSKELIYLPLAGGYDGDYKLSENDGKAFMPHRI